MLVFISVVEVVQSCCTAVQTDFNETLYGDIPIVISFVGAVKVYMGSLGTGPACNDRFSCTCATIAEADRRKDRIAKLGNGGN